VFTLAGVGDNLRPCYAKSRDTEREKKGRGEPLSQSQLKGDGEKDDQIQFFLYNLFTVPAYYSCSMIV
jgi:hypothetical protein